MVKNPLFAYLLILYKKPKVLQCNFSIPQYICVALLSVLMAMCVVLNLVLQYTHANLSLFKRLLTKNIAMHAFAN